MKRLIIFVIAVILNVVSVPAYAAGTAVYAKYLIKQGQLYYESGNFMAATHEFTKVLLLDPNNREAQKYLDDLRVGAALYLHPQANVERAADLAKKVDSYQKDLRDLKKAGNYHEKLNQDLKANLVAKQQQLKQLDGRLAQTIQQLNISQSQLVSLQKEAAQLTSDKTELRQTILVKERSVEDLKLRIVEIQKNVKVQSAKQQALVLNMQKQVSLANAELGRLRQNFVKLQDSFRQQTIELGFRTNKGLITDIQLANHNSQMEAKDKQILELMKVIGELETKIVALGSAPVKSKSRIAKVDKIKAVIIGEQIAVIKEQDKTMAGLKEKLASSRRQLLSLKKDGKIDQIALEELRTQLKGVRIQLRLQEVALEQTQQAYSQSQGQLASTRQHLGFVEAKLEEKDQRIRYLERQLSKISENPGDMSFHYFPAR